MSFAICVFTAGLAISCLLMVIALWVIPSYWKQSGAEYKTERIEKACDAVSTIVAFLIPAALALATWIYEKTAATWYGAPLALGTLWFLFVLGFTMYIRFNLVWGFEEKVIVGDRQNTGIIRWLTSVMVGLTVGLICLAIPIFPIVFGPRPHTQTTENAAQQHLIEKVLPSAQPCPQQPIKTGEDTRTKAAPPPAKGK